MTEFGIFLAIVLAGPVDGGDLIAMSRTTDGRLAYVTRRDCTLGAGQLYVSDRQGNGPDLAAPYTLTGKSPAAVAAGVLCNHWSKQ